MAKQQFETRTIYLPERLEHKLDDIFHYPCTTVVAPAGFGKSTCVREFLDRGTEGEAPLVLWQDVPDGDDSYFLEDLAAAFHTLSRDFSEFLLSSGIPEDKQSRHLFFKKLVELNLSFLQEIVVVLDMGEAAVSERIRNFLEFLVQNLPVRFHLVLIGRQRLLPRGSKLPFYSRINAVTWRDLKFTAADIEKYYRRCGLSPSQKDAQSIERLSEGWIMLVRLNVQEYLEHGRFFSEQEGAALMNRMIFQPLPEEIKEMLMTIGMLKTFTHRQFEYLCTGEQASEHLDELCDRDLFVMRDEYSENYRMENSFASCIQRNFERLPQEIRSDRLTRAGNWYMENCTHFLVARRFYFQAKNYDALMQAVQMRHFVRPYVEDEQDFITYYTECPPEIRIRYPKAILVFAKYLFNSNRRELADRVCREFKKSLECSSGQSQEDLARYRAMYEMLLSYEQFNNLDTMIEHLNRAETLVGEGVEEVFWPETGLNEVPSVLSMYHRHAGELGKEVRLFEEFNLKYSRFTGARNAGAELVMKAEAQYMTGDIRAAEITIYEVQFIANRSKQWGVWLSVIYLKIRIEMMKGNWKNVEELLNETQQTSTDYFEYMLIPADTLCEAYIYCKLRQPQMLTGLFKNGWDENLNTNFRALPTIYALHAEVLLARGEYISLIALFKKYLDIARIYPNLLVEINLEIIVASAYKALDEHSVALEHLSRALELASPDGLIMPFVEMGAYIGPLLSELSVSAFPEIIRSILGRSQVFRQKLDSIRLKFFSSQNGELTPQEIKIAKLVAAGCSNKEIAEKMFISESTVKTHLFHIFSKLEIKKRSQLKSLF